MARSRRAPVFFVLDDLQWADRSAVATVRHLVRFAPRERVLPLGAHPEVDLEPAHPLNELLEVEPHRGWALFQQRPDGSWTTTKPLVELGVPQQVRRGSSFGG